MYKTKVSRKAKKFLEKAPLKTKIRLIKTMKALEKNPFQGKKLGGQRQGSYSVRMWPYRIIYEIHKKEILIYIIDIGHRRDIYELKQ